VYIIYYVCYILYIYTVYIWVAGLSNTINDTSLRKYWDDVQQQVNIQPFILPAVIRYYDDILEFSSPI